MNSNLFLILLILLDFHKPLIIFTAYIQFTIFSLFHVNSFFFETIYNSFKYLCSFSVITFFGLIFCFFYFDITYSLLEMHFNFMVYTLMASVPIFFIYFFYYKTLEDNVHIASLQNVYKINIKFLIIIVSIYNYDLCSSLIFAIWISFCIIKFYSDRKIRLELSQNDIQPIIQPIYIRKSQLSKTTTELELKKLHEYYSINIKATTCLSSDSKKR